MLFERPKDALLEVLREEGLFSVACHVRGIVKRPREDPFQDLAVALLLGKGVLTERREGDLPRGVVYREGVFKFLGGPGDEHPDVVFRKVGSGYKHVLEGVALERLLSRFPLIVIDLSLWERHTEGEKSRLIQQLASSLNVVRAFLWDQHLVLTCTYPSIAERFRRAVGQRARPQVTQESTLEFLRSLGRVRAILLDPNVDEELTTDDVLTADVFVIGGIVDREVPRPGETRLIADKLGSLVERKKIVLRGKLYGVPHRVNRVIELILRTRYVTRDLEKAILSTMSIYDKLWRLRHELVERAIRVRIEGSTKLLISRSVVNELRRFLGLDIEYINLAIRQVGVEVVDDDYLGKVLRSCEVVRRRDGRVVYVFRG
ncbi:MAG: hypothetical protein DRJ40_03185 [Thermoprotei archaeon]|nr:MAG: hypothetical protein DRJ40_03185 [Thermoprotei archaeon]